MNGLLKPEHVARAVPRLAEGVATEVQPDGSLRLNGPELRRGPLSRGFARLLRRPCRIAVELDDIGRFVIERLDGRDMDGLAKALSSYLKLTRREAETSLTLFMQALLRRRLVVLQGMAEACA